MLGIASTELALAYLLSIGAGLLCVIYGIVKYNDSGPLTEELRAEELRAEEEAEKNQSKA